jgi:transcriptional regulator with XRE-family HTH domain
VKPSKPGRQPVPSHQSDFEKDLARLVLRERKRRGWTQEQLARKAKLSVRTVKAVENRQEGRIRFRGGLRLLGLLGLRMRFSPVESPAPENSTRLRRVLQRGEEYLTEPVRRLPPRKRRALMCTTNEVEFLLEAARLVVQEGW